MMTKERIHAEIDRAPEEDLDELYSLIKRSLADQEPRASKPGLLDRLKWIQIDAPEDFAANLDLYMSGGKPLAGGQDPHRYPLRH
jgi:hypothetical protein